MRSLCLLIVTVIGFINKTELLETTACVGYTITPSCSSGEILRLNALYVFAKKTSPSCPELNELPASTYHKNCCTYNTQDCKMDFIGNSKVYFDLCVANSTCEWTVAYQQTTCSNKTDFLKLSNYMIMDYKCINVTDILPITSNDMRSGPSPTLGNPGYPNSSLPANVGGVCSVWASCDTTINVMAIHVEFQNSTGTCQQNIDIEDGGVVTRTINCGDNNGKEPKTLYTSQANFIILRYTTSLAENGGRLWLEFNGTNSEATIHLRCGTSANKTSPGASACPSTTTSTSVVTSTATARSNMTNTTTTTSTNTTITTTTTANTASINIRASTAAVTNHTAAIASTVTGTMHSRIKASQEQVAEATLGTYQISSIVLGILVLLLLLILIIIVVLKIKEKKRGKMSMKVSDCSDSEFAKVLGIASIPAVATVAPSSTQNRPRTLDPIETTGGGSKNAWGNTTGMSPTSSTIKHTPATGSTSHWGTVKTAVFEISKK